MWLFLQKTGEIYLTTCNKKLIMVVYFRKLEDNLQMTFKSLCFLILSDHFYNEILLTMFKIELHAFTCLLVN